MTLAEVPNSAVVEPPSIAFLQPAVTKFLDGLSQASNDPDLHLLKHQRVNIVVHFVEVTNRVFSYQPRLARCRDWLPGCQGQTLGPINKVALYAGFLLKAGGAILLY